MGLLLMASAGFSWILLFEPEWITNHWCHWICFRP